MAAKKSRDYDYLKANRKGSRNAEIENDGKFKPTTRVHKGLKPYNRKQKYKDDYDF